MTYEEECEYEGYCFDEREHAIEVAKAGVANWDLGDQPEQLRESLRFLLEFVEECIT
jgi:hypothetical protein